MDNWDLRNNKLQRQYLPNLLIYVCSYCVMLKVYFAGLCVEDSFYQIHSHFVDI